MNTLIASTAPAAPPPQPVRRLAGRLDGAVTLTCGLLCGIALLAPSQFGDTLRLVADSAAGIAPFLVASVLAAAWLRVAGADRLIGLAFAASPRKAIVLASLLGALSPFCSCGVIPVIAALLVGGVPLAPVMAFWVSSPVMAPDMYLITAGELGFEFATAKALAAIGIGIVAGAATHLLRARPAFAAPLRRLGCSSCAAPMLAGGAVQWAFWQLPGGTMRFAGEALRNGLFLGKWLLLAFTLESLMLAWLPAGLLASWVGDNTLAIPLAALAGVPAYLNGYAAVPVVAGLIQAGMAPGVALAFMVAGAMTSLPAAIAVYTLVKGRVFAWYVLLALLLSMASGYAYALWLAR
jgi:uncharacterized membrane protein YraQ (UPF0718 family)